jgi:hypothetical protein
MGERVQQEYEDRFMLISDREGRISPASPVKLKWARHPSNGGTFNGSHNSVMKEPTANASSV